MDGSKNLELDMKNTLNDRFYKFILITIMLKYVL